MTSNATPRVLDQNLVGIAWMLLTGLLFVAVTGIVRYLGTDLPSIEAAFIRYLFGIFLIIPVLFRLRRRLPKARSLPIYALRGVIHGGAVMLWFFAMARIPIAEVTAIGYTAPIFTTIGAALFLKERLKIHRIAAIIAGFIGVLIILRPGIEIIEIGALAQLGAAPLFACSFLIAKKLTEYDDPAVIVAMLSVFCTLALLPGALLDWRQPTGEELFWLFMTAIFATAGHYTLTKAFEAAPITVTQPVSFLQLLWATLLGWLVFSEEPDPMVFVGGGIIIAALTYIAHREAVRRGKAEPKPGPL